MGDFCGSSQLKSEFIVSPHSRPDRIALRFSGAAVSLRYDGAMVLTAPDFQGLEPPPVAWQSVGGQTRPVAVAFKIAANGDVRFKLSHYDPDRPLVIDPPLTYSSVIGGGTDNAATAIASDPAGNVYIAGWTDSANFPVANALQASSGGGNDAFVLKLNPAGNTLLYATFLGGSGDDRAFGIAVDSAGEATVVGWTQSTNFPTASAAQSSLRGGSGQDAFVAKLNSSGSAFIFSTYLGGSSADAANAVAISALGAICVVGDTLSGDFPTATAQQPNYAGAQDAFVTVYSASGAITYSSFLGGSGQDHGAAITVDGSANIVVAGSTYSIDFPVANPIQARNNGGQDAFVSKFSPAGALLFSSYLGGSGGSPSFPEEASGVAVDTSGYLYLAGTTPSQNFPTAASLQQPHPYGTDIFLAKLDPVNAILIYSTYLGGSGYDVANALAVDAFGRAYVAGQTTSWDFPTVNPYQAALAGGIDGFLLQVSPDGSALQFATYLGGSANDSVNGLAVDGFGHVYLAGQTASTNFPEQGGLIPPTWGSYEAFAVSFNSAYTTPPGAGLTFVPSGPCRVVDTRTAPGPFGAPSLTRGVPRSFPIPSGTCGIPAAAVAYAVNVTVVPQGELGYLTVWPSGQPQPLASTLNSLDGRVKANFALVEAGTSGAISAIAAGATDVILDIQGYFVSRGTAGSSSFYPMTPCRVADTRGAVGPSGAPSLAGGVIRFFPVAGLCGVPLGATAYSLNLTAIPSGSLGFLSAWPAGTNWPGVSNLNAPTGTVTANAAMVVAGSGGQISLLANSATDVAIDVNGYFAPPGPGGFAFYPMPPCRVVDTRGPAGEFGGPSLLGDRVVSLPAGACLIPVANAYSLNATVVPQGFLGYLALWAAGGTKPTVSTLNAYDGSVTSNAAIVPAANGAITAFTTNTTDLILDLNGYFAP